MPYQRLARIILDEWQLIAGHLAGLDANSADAAFFRNAADVLRDEYQHLVEEAIAHQRPEPPPLPELDGPST